ncbi:MAG TPA: histidine phosphatase family protein [Gammaproteobacteria bacterium]|nr:histidine phosphatase family protein [Gammaproteobacteria bacterium]
MARIYLVRHGRAAGDWGSARDPGLDAGGREQARDAARRLHELGPLSVVSSPLARARETADALAGRWRAPVRIEPRVGEIPSPEPGLAERARWLRRVMAGRWRDLDACLHRWREDVVAALTELAEDTVVFSHFVAINAAVGVATGDDRVVVFRPDNASVTVLENSARSLTLVEKGREADTRVV